MKLIAMPKIILMALVFVGVGLVPYAQADEGLDPARKQELQYLLTQDCGSCHGLTRKGGLGSPLLPENLEIYTDADLYDVIMKGRPETAMPPWAPLLSPADTNWLIKLLRTGDKS